MKTSLKIVVIGSIFLLWGASFFGIVSLKEREVSSNFWTVQPLVMSVYADDDEEGEDREER